MRCRRGPKHETRPAGLGERWHDSRLVLRHVFQGTFTGTRTISGTLRFYVTGRRQVLLPPHPTRPRPGRACQRASEEHRCRLLRRGVLDLHQGVTETRGGGVSPVLGNHTRATQGPGMFGRFRSYCESPGGPGRPG